MSTVMEVPVMTNYDLVDIEPAELPRTETTLFDLIATLQDIVDSGDSDDDAAVIAAVVALVQAGRIRLRISHEANN